MPDFEWADQRRGIADALGRALTRHPVVLLVGPAGVGKSTVARNAFGSATAGAFIDLGQDIAARDDAIADPAGFLGRVPAGTVIDDVHRAPPLWAELENLAERSKAAGKVLAVCSMAGLFELARSGGLRRLPRVTMGSLTQSELHDRIGRLIPAAFSGDPAGWPFEALGVNDYVERALSGGLPELVRLTDAEKRSQRYTEAVDDLLGSVAPRQVAQLRSVFDLVANRVTARVSYDQDAAELGVRPNELIGLLETLEALGVVRLSPAWTRFRRAVDSTRAYVRDPGYLGAASRALPGERTRPVPAALALRTLVAHELHTQNGWSRNPVDISFWRSKPSQYDIDFLLEDRTGAVVPVSVSGSLAPGAGEFAGIDAFRRRHPRAFRRGLLLYPGDRIRPLSDHRWAVPLSVLWTVADAEAPLDVASLDTELEAAASALRVLVNRSPAADPNLAEHRAGIEDAMRRSLAPRLERIALVLASLGLGVESVAPFSSPPSESAGVAPPWFAGLQAALAAGVAHAQLTVVSGLEIRTAGTEADAGTQWVAFVSAVLDGSATVSWQAGHALLPAVGGGADQPPGLVGMAGPLLLPIGDVEEVMVDQLCAALAASLPDALAALTPAA